MTEYRQSIFDPYNRNKKIVANTYDKKMCRFPDISHNALFIPLEGGVNKNVDYINYTMIHNLSSYPDNQTIITFHTFLELIIPLNFQCMEQHFDTCFEYYIFINYHEGRLGLDPTKSDHFTAWPGNYFKDKQTTMIRGVNKATHDDYRFERVAAESQLFPPNLQEKLVDQMYAG